MFPLPNGVHIINFLDVRVTGDKFFIDLYSLWARRKGDFSSFPETINCSSNFKGALFIPIVEEIGHLIAQPIFKAQNIVNEELDRALVSFMKGNNDIV